MNFNNNIEMSGHYRIIWWRQPQLYQNYPIFLSKLGYDSELITWNQNLTNLQIEASEVDVTLTFSRGGVGTRHIENIRPGLMLEEENYQAIWYR